MDGLIQLLANIPAGMVLGWIVAIVLAIKNIYQLIQKYRKARNGFDEKEDQVTKNQSDIKVLKEQTEDLQQMLIEQVSRLDEKDLLISQKLNHVIQAIDDISRYQKAKDMNDLKDRINTKYRLYKQRARYNNGVVFLSKNELESFEGLIDSYSAAGGNSFVHKDIQPDIMNWVVVSEEEIAKKVKN